MVNYKNTKIFTIRNKINDKIFATLNINEGLNGFKRSLKDLKNEMTQAFEEIGVFNFYYELEEEIECENKESVNKSIDRYIQKYDSIRNGYNSTKTRQKKGTTFPYTLLQPSFPLIEEANHVGGDFPLSEDEVLRKA
jgi:hypothetical protein